MFYVAFQDVNRIISRFAALRIGAAATKLTAAARQGFRFAADRVQLFFLTQLAQLSLKMTSLRCFESCGRAQRRSGAVEGGRQCGGMRGTRVGVEINTR